MAGISASGFATKRLADIVSDVDRGLRDAFGQEIVTGPGTGFGKLVGVLARELAELWELGQDAYDSHYPDTAEGAALDLAAAFTGHRRLAARASRAWLRCDGLDNTSIPAGSRAAHAQTKRQFQNAAAGTITRAQAARARWRVSGGPHAAATTVTATFGTGITYLLTMGGAGAFDPVANATDAQVAQKLADAINAGFAVASVNQALREFTVTGDRRAHFPARGACRVSLDPPPTNDGTYTVVSASLVAGNTVVRVAESIPQAGAGGYLRGALVASVSAADVTADVEVPPGEADLSRLNLAADAASSVAGRLALLLVGTPVAFDSVELDRVEAAAGTVTAIDTPVIGWQAVTNPIAADPGNPLESDADFRVRRADTLRIAGSSALDAVRARLRAVANVDRVQVVENDGDAADADGRPPHSFEAIVSGGLDADVAKTIWQHKPTGIATFGTTTVTVTDTQGLTHAVRFSRPVTRLMHVRVNLALYAEEPLPADAAALVRAAVATAGNKLLPGVDVIPQRFAGPVHAAVTGLESAGVELAVDNGAGQPGGIDGTAPAGTYVTVRVPMSSTQQANFDVNRVVVTGI